MGRPLFGAQPTRPHHGDLCSCNTCMPLPPDTHLWSAPARSSTPTPSGEPSDDSEGRPRSPSTSAPASSLDVYTQTRDSLRLASTALDAAYTRLRELRIAIRGLSAASDGMSPGHTAIVLSGGEGATTDNAMPESSPAETGLLRIPNISSIRRDDARASLSHNAHSVLDPPEPSPLEPIRSPASSTVVAVDQSSTMSQGRLRQLRTRRSLLEDHLRLRREDTLGVIGRRATARAAVETASATGSRAEETQSLYDRSIQIANELEQTIDRYLSNRRLLSNALATGQRTSALARMDEVSRIGRSNSEGVGSISPTEQPASSRSRVVPPARRVTSNTPRLSLGLRALDIFQRHHTNPTDSLNNPTSGPTLPRPQRSFRDNDTSTSVDDLDDTMSWLMRPRDNAYERFLQVADGQDAPREPAHNRGLASETGEDADQDGLLATTSPQTRRRRWGKKLLTSLLLPGAYDKHFCSPA
ncbi:hypothetical protein NEOLEDRAFT_519550 [Neolentinus lepideus HHB14362 ss-1]|uniref:Uncharacterized protein n=1 Tax=Neolentinus lepideus HHB14362 ss-1 TaxID=1314782 RepID=A0A165RI10_9AGAM|nr:hypothetical protein NEOLEDRAFT_519550 [Neolentinus lepideus HHB14362 ss-1]